MKLTYNWTLTDPAGSVLHTISAEEVAPGSPAGDPWLQVTPAVLQRVAAYTAESLSSRLSQLGYATQVGGMPPPLETYAKAGPDADKDIDFETLYGPRRRRPLWLQAQQPADGKAASKASPGDDKALAAVDAEPADTRWSRPQRSLPRTVPMGASGSARSSSCRSAAPLVPAMPISPMPCARRWPMPVGRC